MLEYTRALTKEDTFCAANPYRSGKGRALTRALRKGAASESESGVKPART